MAPTGSPRDRLRPASSIRAAGRQSIGPSPTNCPSLGLPKPGSRLAELRSVSAANVQRRAVPGDRRATACSNRPSESTQTASRRPCCREREAERLDEDHGGELLYDQDASRLGIDHLLPHPVEGPAQILAIGLALDLDVAGSMPISISACGPAKLEMAAEHRHPAAVVQLDQRAFWSSRKWRFQSSGGRAGSLASSKRRAVGQQEVVALLEKHRLASPLHREPARARGHGVAFNPLKWIEADRPVAARLEAADAIVSQLQKLDDLGQRIHLWTISNKL